MPPLLEDWAAAWSTNDALSLSELYATDAELDDVTAGVVYRGSDEITDHVAEVHSGFSEVEIVVTTGFIADDWAAAAYTFSGTYTGTYAGLPPGTGQSVSIRGATLTELAGEQIRREAHYFDGYEFLIQLGVLPEPEAAED